ncbi:MAG: hypothetical protein ACTSW1_11310 [Candidatus Hodarchaeales archaeon]
MKIKSIKIDNFAYTIILLGFLAFSSFLIQRSLYSSQQVIFDREESSSIPKLMSGNFIPLDSTIGDIQDSGRGVDFFHVHSSVQESESLLLNVSGEKDNFTLTFSENIWNDSLGTDVMALQNPSMFENGLIVTNESVGSRLEPEVNNSLFIRIGNAGYGSEYNEDLNDDWAISEGLSAGWSIPFTVDSVYEFINVTFKWRYDAIDNAFEYDRIEFMPGVVLDENPDFQEIRARISNSNSSLSFWLEHEESPSNPNGTVFYHRGPVVEGDEEWYQESYLFSVNPDQYSLELGAYMNTREFSNEFFDVWFDCITIRGVTNATDVNPPAPYDFGLTRTSDVVKFNFYTRFHEGIWESPIENVTVYYNKTSNENITSFNASLKINSGNLIDNAGYNNSYWNYTANFEFEDNITYYFTIFDTSGNSYLTHLKNTIINDTEAPVIVSSLNTANRSFVKQYGNGTILICIKVYDWGNATNEVKFTYMVNSIQGSKYMTFNGTHYITKIDVDYNDELQFNITLKDSEGNMNDGYSGFVVKSNIDVVNPVIESSSFIVYPDVLYENVTHVNVTAVDPYGEISSVFIEIYSLENHLYNNLTLFFDNVTNQYYLRSLLRLNYSQSYVIRTVVRDQGGLNDSESLIYIVPDFIPPELDIVESEYNEPGQLKVWVTSDDFGSGLKSLVFERKTKSGWSGNSSLLFSEKRKQYYLLIETGWFGNERVEVRVIAMDYEGNTLIKNRVFRTDLFIVTPPGLFFTEALITIGIAVAFTTIKIAKAHKIKTIRRRRFDVALKRSERLAYLGEEAIFGFVAAYGQREGSSSILLWEPRLIGSFYQYLRELVDKAHTNFDFVMRVKAENMNSYVDFSIEQISCSAIVFAYPAPTLPQQWLSSISLDHVPSGRGQGVLLLMLLMREKWAETSQNFQEEIAEGIQDLKNRILAGETKESIIEHAKEFRLFISGTVEVLDEIEVESEEYADDIMSSFEDEFLSDDSEEDDEHGEFSH